MSLSATKRPARRKRKKANNVRTTSTYKERNNEAKNFDIPVLYQSHPKKITYQPQHCKKDRTPSSSILSRNNWASKEGMILNRNHIFLPPQFTAVIKFKKPTMPYIQNQFIRSLRQRFEYICRKYQATFAVYWVCEIERNNCIHYHFLIRTTLSHRQAKKFLQSKVNKAGKGLARLRYFKPIESISATTKYIVKDIQGINKDKYEVLLFTRESGLRVSGQFGNYFYTNKSKVWQAAIKDWLRKKRRKKLKDRLQLKT